VEVELTALVVLVGAVLISDEVMMFEETGSAPEVVDRLGDSAEVVLVIQLVMAVVVLLSIHDV